MARINFKATIGQALGPGANEYAPSADAGGGPTASTISTTTVATDVATLVADAALPTQAHVNTLNTDWAALLAAIAAQTTANSGNVSVSVDTAVVTTITQLRRAFDAILRAAQGSGSFTG